MKKIPIDNVIQCRFSGRTPGSLQGAFWHVMHEELDKEQARLLEGKRMFLTERLSMFKFSRPVVVDELLGPTLLPSVPIKGRTEVNGITDPVAVEYAKEFSIRIQAGWQRDVVLRVLHRFTGKYFHFDFGGQGADKRRLPMGRHLATKGRVIGE